MKNKFEFDKVIAKLNAVKSTVPDKLANATLNYFLRSWKVQGWDGEAWKVPLRRFKKGGSSRNQSATLVQSGKLRRAVANSLVSANFDKIVFRVSGIPYSQIHNDGGVIQKSSRTGIMSFARSESGGLKLAKTKTKKQRKEVVSQHKHEIGSHEIKMPKRRFIGDTKELRNKQINILKKEIDRIWQ